MYHKTATKTSWIWEMDLMNLNSTKHIWTYYIQFYECTSAKKDMRNCVHTHFSGGQNSSAASAFSRVELESEWIEVWLAVNYSLSWSLMPSTPAAVSQVSIESSLPKTLSPAHLLQPYPPPIPPPNTNNPSLSPAPSPSRLHPSNCKAGPDDIKHFWICLQSEIVSPLL